MNQTKKLSKGTDKSTSRSHKLNLVQIVIETLLRITQGCYARLQRREKLQPKPQA